MSPSQIKEEEESEGEERPLSPRELKELRKLMKDLDRYLFAMTLVRRVAIGFSVMVGVLYGGRDIIGRIWKAVVQ